MSKLFIRFPLLVLLALLQCFAPLLHAHAPDAHGAPAVAGVHLHDLDGWHAADALASDTPALVADHGHGQVIAMVREFRQDSVMALSDDDQPDAPSVDFVAGTAVFRVLFPLPASPPDCLSSHIRPYPQAPPLFPV